MTDHPVVRCSNGLIPRDRLLRRATRVRRHRAQDSQTRGRILHIRRRIHICGRRYFAAAGARRAREAVRFCTLGTLELHRGRDNGAVCTMRCPASRIPEAADATGRKTLETPRALRRSSRRASPDQSRMIFLGRFSRPRTVFRIGTSCALRRRLALSKSSHADMTRARSLRRTEGTAGV
jgi:hypothetical protein